MSSKLPTDHVDPKSDESQNSEDHKHQVSLISFDDGAREH